MECPICENKITDYKCYVESGGVIEEYADCQNCEMYCYEFSCGNSREFINTFEVQRFWDDLPEERKKMDLLSKLLITKAKLEYYHSMDM